MKNILGFEGQLKLIALKAGFSRDEANKIYLKNEYLIYVNGIDTGVYYLLEGEGVLDKVMKSPSNPFLTGEGYLNYINLIIGKDLIKPSNIRHLSNPISDIIGIDSEDGDDKHVLAISESIKFLNKNFVDSDFPLDKMKNEMVRKFNYYFYMDEPFNVEKLRKIIVELFIEKNSERFNNIFENSHWLFDIVEYLYLKTESTGMFDFYKKHDYQSMFETKSEHSIITEKLLKISKVLKFSKGHLEEGNENLEEVGVEKGLIHSMLNSITDEGIVYIQSREPRYEFHGKIGSGRGSEYLEKVFNITDIIEKSHFSNLKSKEDKYEFIFEVMKYFSESLFYNKDNFNSLRTLNEFKEICLSKALKDSTTDISMYREVVLNLLDLETTFDNRPLTGDDVFGSLFLIKHIGYQYLIIEVIYEFLVKKGIIKENSTVSENEFTVNKLYSNKTKNEDGLTLLITPDIN